MEKYVCKRLKDKVGVWRVDGIGLIRDHGRLGAGSLVHFSRIDESYKHDPFNFNVRPSECLSLSVHSAALTQFKVGTVWHAGEQIGVQAPYEKPLIVDVSRAQIVNLNQTKKMDGRIIDSIIPKRFLSYFGATREFLKDTKYILVPVVNHTDANWMIIPCSEILRFYCGVSSRLLSSVLQGTTDKYVRWGEKLNCDDGLVLNIKQKLNRVEKFVFVRTLTSNFAKEALFGPHKYLSKINSDNGPLNATQKLPLVISCTFPFNDQTSLTVTGKKFTLLQAVAGDGNTDLKVVFAMEILRCNHPSNFPYAPVIQEDDKYGESIKGSGSPDGFPWEMPSPDYDGDEGLDTTDLAPNARIRKISNLLPQNQFAAMDNLKFKYERCGSHLSQASNSKITSGEKVKVTEQSYADGNYSHESKNIVGVGDFIQHVEKIDRHLSSFLQVIQHLRNTKNGSPFEWQIDCIGLPTRLPDETTGEIVTAFPDFISKRKTWHKISEVNGKEHRRQVAVVHITMGAANKNCYLFEMEIEPGQKSDQCTILLFCKNFSAVSIKDLKEFLRLTAVKRRWISIDSTWDNGYDRLSAQGIHSRIEIKRINHQSQIKPKKNSGTGVQSSDDVVGWAELILNRMKKELLI